MRRSVDPCGATACYALSDTCNFVFAHGFGHGSSVKAMEHSNMMSIYRMIRAHMFAITVVIAPAVAHAQTMTPLQADSTNAAQVNVALSSYEFSPARVTLVHGTAYRLHLTNTGGKGHNFSAPQLFAASLIAPQDQAKVEDGTIEVDGGQTVDVVFVPMTPGEYDIRCTHFLHSAFGMHAKAIVR